MSVHIARGWKCPARKILLLTQTLRVSCGRAHAEGTTDTHACPGGVSKARPGLRRRGLEGLSGGKVGRTGLGRPLAQPTSLVQNPQGCWGGWWWVGRAPGSWAVWGRGAAESACPFPPAEPGRNRARGKGGPAGLRAQGAGHHVGTLLSPRPPGPRCPAHSKVSHCFLSCSTEPGAGAGAGAWAGAWAGLTSCLVLRSKSSKGSLVS